MKWFLLLFLLAIGQLSIGQRIGIGLVHANTSDRLFFNSDFNFTDGLNTVNYKGAVGGSYSPVLPYAIIDFNNKWSAMLRVDIGGQYIGLVNERPLSIFQKKPEPEFSRYYDLQVHHLRAHIQVMRTIWSFNRFKLSAQYGAELAFFKIDLSKFSSDGPFLGVQYKALYSFLNDRFVSLRAVPMFNLGVEVSVQNIRIGVDFGTSLPSFDSNATIKRYTQSRLSIGYTLFSKPLKANQNSIKTDQKIKSSSKNTLFLNYRQRIYEHAKTGSDWFVLMTDSSTVSIKEGAQAKFKYGFGATIGCSFKHFFNRKWSINTALDFSVLHPQFEEAITHLPENENYEYSPRKLPVTLKNEDTFVRYALRTSINRDLSIKENFDLYIGAAVGVNIFNVRTDNAWGGELPWLDENLDEELSFSKLNFSVGGRFGITYRKFDASLNYSSTVLSLHQDDQPLQMGRLGALYFELAIPIFR
jgi:hypothetical protein